MSTYSSSSTEQTSAEVKYSILWRISSAVGEYRQLALGKPLITSDPQGLSCTSLVLCYILHLGGNTGNVGNTSSRATLQPLCWFLDCPTLQSHWLSHLAHTGRLHCWSDSRPVLLTTLEFIHFHLELPSHHHLSLELTAVAVGLSQAACVCSGPGSAEFRTDLVCFLLRGCTSESVLPKITELQALSYLVHFL